MPCLRLVHTGDACLVLTRGMTAVFEASSCIISENKLRMLPFFALQLSDQRFVFTLTPPFTPLLVFKTIERIWQVATLAWAHSRGLRGFERLVDVAAWRGRQDMIPGTCTPCRHCRSLSSASN